MGDVSRAAVTRIEDGRDRRISRAVAARRRLDHAPSPDRANGGERQRVGGRVWVNGVEVGGTDPRHSSLGQSYD